MRSGGWERSARDARAVPVIDTGASIAGPDGDASCRSWSRRWSTPASGRPRRSASRRSTRPTATIAARIERVEARERDERGGGRRRRPAAGRRAPARPSATAPTTSRSPASAPGGRRSRSSTARAAGRCRSPRPTCRSSCRATWCRPAKGTRWPSAPTSSTSSARSAAAPAKRETDTLDCHFDALFLWVPAAVPPEDRAEQMFTHPDLQEWLPAERLVAGGDSRRLRLRPADRHQGAARPRRVRLHGGRRAVRRLPLPRDGDRRRPQDEQAPRQRRRPRRAGRAVRRRHRARRGALRGRAGEDAELVRRRDPLRQPLPAQPLDLLPRPLRRARGRHARRRRRRPTPSTCATGCANGARTGSSGSPRTPRSCRCTSRSATSPASSSGSRSSRSGCQAPRPARPGRRRGAGRRLVLLLARPWPRSPRTPPSSC